jgi:hypothetical protein
MEAPAPRSEVGNWCNGMSVGLKFRDKGLGVRVKGIGSWVQGLGSPCRVAGLPCIRLPGTL